MSLVLYRRHLKACPVHALNLPPRAKRHYSECDCPIWMYGRTENALYPRQSTGHTDMTAAEALRRSLDASGKDEQVHGLRIEDCIRRYIDSRQHELAPKTSGQFTLLLGRLLDYCTHRGTYFMRELTVDILESFKTEALRELADTTRSTSTAKLRCFLKDALRRGWITEPLALQVRPHRAVYDQKSPYSDKEVERILSGVDSLGRGTHGYAAHPQTFRLLLELMLGTGLRVGDAILYNPRQCEKGEKLWIYSYHPQKTKRTDRPKTIEAYLPARLKLAIDKCHWLSSSLPFHYGNATDPVYLVNGVYARMQTIGRECGIPDCRPHRLRDTFAVRSLLRGVPLDDVSRLLGHSSVKVTEMYYAKWVPARRRRLERVVSESLMDKRRH